MTALTGFVDRRDGVDVEHSGHYSECERPSRLVFSFAVPAYAPGSDRVVVEIAAQVDGCTSGSPTA